MAINRISNTEIVGFLELSNRSIIPTGYKNTSQQRSIEPQILQLSGFEAQPNLRGEISLERDIDLECRMGKLEGEDFISLPMRKSFIIAATSIAYVIGAATTSNAGTQTRKNNNTGCIDQSSLTGIQHAAGVEKFSLSANDVKAVCKLLNNYYANYHQKVDNTEGGFKNRAYKEVTKVELVALWKTPKSTKELDVFVTQNLEMYSWNSEGKKWEIMPNATQRGIIYKFVFEKKNGQWQALKTEERDTSIYKNGEYSPN